MIPGSSGNGSSMRDTSQVEHLAVADIASASPTMTSKSSQLASQTNGPTPKKKGAIRPRCKVEGCGVDVSDQKEQNKRYRICDFHVKCEFVKLQGNHYRFCQQCSRMQPLNEFDGPKRSCRESLEKIGFKRRTKSIDAQGSASLTAGLQTPPSLKRRAVPPSPTATPSSGPSKLAPSQPGVVAAASLSEQRRASSSGTHLNNNNEGASALAPAAPAAAASRATTGGAEEHAPNAAAALLAHQVQSSAGGSPSPSSGTPLSALQPLLLKVPDHAAILRNHFNQSTDEAFLSPTNLELSRRSQHTLFSLLPQPMEENGIPQTPSPTPGPQWTAEQESATKASQPPATAPRVFSNLSQSSFPQRNLSSPPTPEPPATQPMLMLHETPMSRMTDLSGRRLSGRSFTITGANKSPTASPAAPSVPFSQGPVASAAPPQSPVLHQSPQPSGLLGPSFPSVQHQQPIQAIAAAAAAAAPAPKMSWPEAVAMATTIYQQRQQGPGHQGDGAAVGPPGGSEEPLGSLQFFEAFAKSEMMAQHQQEQEQHQRHHHQHQHQQQQQQQYQPQQQQQQQQQYQPQQQQQQQQQQYQPQQQQQQQQQYQQQQHHHHHHFQPQQQQQQYQPQQQQQQYQPQPQKQYQPQQQQQKDMVPLPGAMPIGSLQDLGAFTRSSGGSEDNTAHLVSAAARDPSPRQISGLGSFITQAMQGGSLLQQSPHSAAVTAAAAAAASATPPWPVTTVGEQQMQQSVPPLDLMRHLATYPEPPFLSPRPSGDLESMMAMCSSPNDALLFEKPSWA